MGNGKNNYIGANQGKRAELDFYPTPIYATAELLKKEKFKGSIWECACGNGAMSNVLKEHGYSVYSSDITDRGYGENRNLDFLSGTNIKADNIITNPPFKLAKEFVEKALTIAKYKVAIIQRLAFLESKSRYELFKKSPLKTVYVFSKRLGMYANGIQKESINMLAFAWFVWDKEYSGKPYLDWIYND